MTPSFFTTIRVLSAVLFTSAFLQLAANLRLLEVSREALIRAVHSGPWPTIYIAALACGIALIITFIKRRLLWWIHISILSFVGLSILILRAFDAPVLNIIYFGETALFHYNSILAAFLALILPWKWSQDTPPIKITTKIKQLLPWLSSALGSLLLLLVHIKHQPGIPWTIGNFDLQSIGAGILLASSPIALVVYWKKIETPHLCFAAIFLALPWIVRLLVTGTGGLAGEPVPSSAIQYVGISIVVSALAVAILVRPQIPLLQRIASGGLSLIFCLILLVYYRGQFGELEDNFDGLSRALFGFSIPYPAYVMDWQATALLTAIFFIAALTLQCLMSISHRDKGIAFGLYAITGIGLTSPNLALLLGVSSLLFIDSTFYAFRSESAAPADAMDEAERGRCKEVLQEIAQQLQLPSPLVIHEGKKALQVVRGKLHGFDIDIRLQQPRAKSATIKINMGIETKNRPALSLIPDSSQRGHRPAHLLARSHRIKGLPRMMESVKEELLDALLELPDARIDFWPARAEIVLSRISKAPSTGAIVCLVSQVAEQLPEIKVGPA